jgi:hypothetical protein
VGTLDEETDQVQVIVQVDDASAVTLDGAP